MRVITEIGDRRSFVLTKALLIYEEQLHRSEQFVTVHDIVREGTQSQHPGLGPGNLLTMDFLERLSAGLERPATAVLLPENVLVYTSNLLIWWTPPRFHTMFFSEGAEDRAAIDGKVFPHPALIWEVYRGYLTLRALRDPCRPNADTSLMVAPYWNIEPKSGRVCEGSMPRPRETNLSNMLEWEEGFFCSRFTHPSGIGKLTTHPRGFMGLWTELAGREHFPSDYLKSASQSLGQFIGRERHD